MLKYLRIAVTALSLTACVLLIALWVRSYSTNDYLTIGGLKDSQTVLLQSIKGSIVVAHFNERNRPNNFDAYFHIPMVANASKGCPAVFFDDAELKCLIIRHWFLVTATTALAALPWMRWRFSLRTLLIATTLVAVGLGIVVVSM